MTDSRTLKIIGIAGGIGSGKSTVTDYLKKLQYRVLDADEIAREAVMRGEPALKELVSFFGSSILEDNGSLNRRKLAQITFGNKDKTKKLNEILHKDISERIDAKLNRYANEYGTNDDNHIIFISAPLFFEAELEKKCDETWAVIADTELRINRAIERDNLPPEEIEDRIKRQMSDEKRAELADHIITNNSTKDQLIEQVNRLLKDT